ncbi:hypothetical protein GCM10023115_41660 [Pontixanthobacter gangjinensis]|uniref:Uncharacterized protein n=1 Tax=Christiangramia aestuarii TaxID=1028746 RepID=A0A7K1LRM4_9FLAO|nr:hypothetical protein [Christiangramia aestuarii]MUP43447.1 hypothetical protein [Christiangramia aestuarii]
MSTTKYSKLKIIVIVAFLCFSCSKKFSTTELKNNFSERQIKDLELLTAFFKNQICTNNSKTNFKKCFENLPPAPEFRQEGHYPISDHIDFNEQKIIYDKISKSTFEEIWNLCESYYPDSGRKTKEICSAYKGNYQNFLIEVGLQNDAIKNYAERITGSGDFNGLFLTQHHIIKNKKDFDLNDPNIQLIIAIQYLSINDQLNRNPRPKLDRIPKFE